MMSDGCDVGLIDVEAGCRSVAGVFLEFAQSV